MSDSRLDRNTRSEPLPRERLQQLHVDRWGYKDAGFRLNANGDFEFQGTRYPIQGVVPHLRQYVGDKIEAYIEMPSPPRVEVQPDQVPDPVSVNDAFVRDIQLSHIPYSTAPLERVFRSHGHCVQEVGSLRAGILPERLVDMVIWPETQDEVVKIVNSAVHHNVVIVPFGGGTNVSMALKLNPKEERMIISLDTSQMNKILWIDEENLVARIQAGVTGVDLENELVKKGWTVGHEPDSFEFSTLGGWVATRASGMKKNLYGNIEDLLVHVSVVTPKGVMEKSFQAPRVSIGPDIHHFILGSEECTKYGSLLFHTFEDGVAFMREIARQRCPPVSVRLVDNEQFHFGLSLKQPSGSLLSEIGDFFKKVYVLKLKGFQPNKMAMCSLMFQGTKDEVASQEERIFGIASKFRGISAGEETGQRGYLLTFLIAYIRDLGFDYHIWAESFETAVPWDRVEDLCRNVKLRIYRECKDRGISFKPYVSCRVTQIYDVGACVYFYFAFNGRGLANPIPTYEEIEEAARDEIIDNGGSLSHHHGVGKLRGKWLQDVVGAQGLGMMHAVKKFIDPTDVFAIGNLKLGEENGSGNTLLSKL